MKKLLKWLLGLDKPTAICHNCCSPWPKDQIKLVRCGISGGHFCPECLQGMFGSGKVNN